jgi:anti-sigma regulatory factor (Ser/Thr protein kinase)
MNDEITLTLPRQRSFYRVAHLVLGGLAVRLDLTFEHLEDIQLALDGLLDRPDEDGEVTIQVSVADGRLDARIGPFDEGTLEHEFDRAGEGDVTLRRLLQTVMDRVEVAHDDGGEWVRLSKTVARAEAQS